jgi:hypothetical protein
MEPLNLIKEAQKAVPAVKFALGIAGVAAAVAIVMGLIKDPKVAVFGTIIMLGLMCILLVFSRIARKTDSTVIVAFAYVLVGFFVLMIMGATFLLFTSAFLEYPRPLDQLFRSRPVNVTATPTPSPAPLESELVSKLKGKTAEWVNRVFTAQASNGGIKESPSAGESTVEVWTSAQCLAGILSTQIDLQSRIGQLKNAFQFIESKRRSTPSAGWNLYGDASVYTVTEINSWVALAYVKSLESTPRVWNESESVNVLTHIDSDLMEIVQRQEPDGGWRPIRDNHPGFTRSYSTILALWSLIEARKSPVVGQHVGNRYDENVRRGINWFLRTYKEPLGWVQNPNRVGQSSRYDGLTAQILFVLSRAEDLAPFSFIKDEHIYRAAKRQFILHSDFAKRSVGEQNSNVIDADQRFPETEYQAEGSTFLWFPWTLATLTQLAADQSLSSNERKGAAQMRLEILQFNANALDSYVESANLMYLLGENLFCVAFSIRS